ncbi:MAG: zinc-dependent metalloprotease [Betaproteobacteria bacterium]
MLTAQFSSLSKLTVALAAASLLAGGCATISAADSATMAAAAVAATGAARSATENTSPIATGAAHGSTEPGSAKAGGAPAVAAAAAAAAAAVAAQQKPFADVVKDAKEQPGFFNVYSKDEKVWLEIRPDQIDRPFFLQANRTNGIGERDPFTSPMLRSYIVEFHRLGNLVQMIAKNTQFMALEGTPLARAARESTSDSLLGSVPVASQPHAERKSVLIELNPLLLSDLPAGASALEAAYKISYAFDSRNSSFTGIHNGAHLTGFAVSAHYGVPKLPSRPANGAAPRTPPPAHLEDARSLFLGYYYSFARLPEPMHARPADDRIGHFVARRWDFSDDIKAFPEIYYVKRWRLEKGDPDAALSEPKQPIVYWLDRNIPEKYRETVKAGILEWNKAFEKIGFKDALRVEVQPDNADFDTADGRHASVRWVVRDEPGALAIGPSRADPRTGEILDADIEIEDGWTRLPRRQASEQFHPRARAMASGEDAYCDYGDVAMDELAFALDLMVARGDIDPQGPEAQKYVLATLKDVVTHEVGHTLGLQHNFRASTIYTQKQLEDPAFTRVNGIGGSVMDYNAINLALQTERQGDYVMPTIGPYDYWAIEYAYKPIAPEQEKVELAQIAARSDEPRLAFANDIDAGFGGMAEGTDPQVNRRDLGSDPLEFATRRLKLSRELWDRLQDRKLPPGQSYEVLRRNFIAGLTQLGNSGAVAAKYVGGVVYVRDHAGSGREPFTPVPPDKQRAALKLIADGLLSVDSFRLRPEFVRRLTVDQFDRGRENAGIGAISPDISLSDRMLSVQRALLDQLLSDKVATRIEESAYRQTRSSEAFRLSELYDTLQSAVWNELATGRDITPFRRNLQREYLRRVATTIVHPSPSDHADGRALQRANARQLLAQLKSAKSRASFSKEARAHLAECENTIDEALKAPMLRPDA